MREGEGRLETSVREDDMPHFGHEMRSASVEAAMASLEQLWTFSVGNFWMKGNVHDGMHLT